MLHPVSCLNRREKSYHEALRRWAVRGVRLPFFGFVLLHSASPPSLSSFSSRSFQRRTCSWRIFRNRVFFCSSLRASSTSGSMYMSFKICCSILAAGWSGQPGYHPAKLFRERRRCPLAGNFSDLCWFTVSLYQKSRASAARLFPQSHS